MAYIYGGPGVDTLYGTTGEQNWIYGYSGNDTLVGVDFQLAGIFYQGEGGDVLYGGFGNDSLWGMGGNDTLHGEDGNDMLDGGNGDDLLRGGAGMDSINGGAGRDRVSLYHLDATQAAYVNLIVQTIYNDGYGNYETMTSIEDIGQGTRFADTFIGDNFDNYILADKGDEITANDGNDVIDLYGTPGVIDGGNGIDAIGRFYSQTLVADYNGDGLADLNTAYVGVTVDLGAFAIYNDGFGNGGNVFNVENVGGSDFGDLIYGDAGANQIWGHGGEDKLFGRDGADSIGGGDGRDSLYGGAGADLLEGQDGNDTIEDGDGDDRILGGIGKDYMIAGNGQDVYVCKDAAESTMAAGGRDRIDYFSSGNDKVDIRDLIDEVSGGNPLSFATSGFTGIAGEVTIVNLGGGTFSLEADLNGDMAGDFSIRFYSTGLLAYTDILI